MPNLAMMRADHNMTYSPWERLRRSGVPLVLALLCVGLAGCGSVEEANLNAYLDELEFGSQTESLKEFKLGKFHVSVATRAQDAKGKSRTWVDVSCKLYVIIAPEDESAVSSAYDEHKGVFDDMVVEVFRSSSIEELNDPRWATIKSRITDLARPILGADRVRQIVVDDFGWKPI